jgi:hypothetical protein
VVRFTLQPLYSQERASDILWIGSLAGPRATLNHMEKRKFLTLSGLELRALYCPAHSQSLYRLRYPGSQFKYGILCNFCDDLIRVFEVFSFHIFMSQNYSYFYVTQNTIIVCEVRVHQTPALTSGGTLCGTQKIHEHTLPKLVTLPKLNHDTSWMLLRHERIQWNVENTLLSHALSSTWTRMSMFRYEKSHI